MHITLDIAPDTEEALRAEARAKGLSVTNYVEQIVAREAASITRPSPDGSGRALVEAAAKVRGLLTNQEVDRLFARDRVSTV